MKAQIVNVTDLKKTQAEKEAELLLQELLSGKDGTKAIEVLLEQKETSRKINHIFRKAAATLGKEIRTQSKEGRVIIRIK